jgi:hypothetical protein
MNLTTWLLALIVSALASLAGGYWYGRLDGAAASQAAQDHQTVAELSDIVTSHKALIEQSNKASQAMRQAATRREAADRKSTQELRDALAITAPARAECVFDAGVMRQLSAARDRAAAAAAGGIRGALPESAASAWP